MTLAACTCGLIRAGALVHEMHIAGIYRVP